MRTLLRLGDVSCEIRVGQGIVASLGHWLRYYPSRKAVLIADSRLKKPRQAVVKVLKEAGWQVTELPVEAGEKLKDFQAVYPMYGKLLQAGIDRGSLLVALGGGTVGDAAGFIAATYLRGIAWVGLPTTLLAQVDSSVGGKTGVNHAQGKNLIGAFHQPTLVLADTGFLKTLPARDIVSGVGEVLKIALVFDPELLARLTGGGGKGLRALLARQPAALEQAIGRAITWKARMVERDERERRGIRESLNFGHTFGHALEAETGYGALRHGEAVIWGMRFALALSEVRGLMPARERSKLDAALGRLPVPKLPRLSFDRLVERMAKDKKALGGKHRFVLLERPGRWLVDDGVTRADLDAAAALLGLAGVRPGARRKKGGA